jgi:hypothetical protein
MSQSTSSSGFNSLISMEDIIGRLGSFFTDSVILRMNYEIEALGTDVESMIGFTSSHLAGKPFWGICNDPGIRGTVEEQIRQGYFEGLVTNLLTHSNEPVTVTLSGFYLGLISDINGYIVLKVKVVEDTSFLKNELVTKKRELDSFIYRTAHDLRGPIATIKGLVNLLKMRQDEGEVDQLTHLIELHANKLDDRLFKLLYVADCSDDDYCNGILSFETLKQVLQTTLKDNFQVGNTTFSFVFSGQKVPYINESRLTRLLNNILLYIVGLPIATIPTQNETVITIALEPSANNLDVQVFAKGFLVSDEIVAIINHPTYLYNDILNHPFLFNYYVAHREAAQLNATLRVNFIQTDEQFLHLVVPLNFSLRIKQEKEQLESNHSSTTQPVSIHNS